MNAQEIRQAFAEVDALIESGEVITASQAADLLGVDPATVSNYIRRHDDFPRLIDAPRVCGQAEGSNYRRRAFFIRSEVIAWGAARAEQAARRAKAARRRKVATAKLAELVNNNTKG